MHKCTLFRVCTYMNSPAYRIRFVIGSLNAFQTCESCKCTLMTPLLLSWIFGHNLLNEAIPLTIPSRWVLLALCVHVCTFNRNGREWTQCMKQYANELTSRRHVAYTVCTTTFLLGQSSRRQVQLIALATEWERERCRNESHSLHNRFMAHLHLEFWIIIATTCFSANLNKY